MCIRDSTYAELLKKDPEAIAPIYIVGSEVPIPGGAVGSEDNGCLLYTSIFLTSIYTNAPFQ